MDIEYGGPLVGLKGEVFKSPDGRIAGAIPPLGVEGAIPFEILGEYPGQNPPWADMLVAGNVKCRINPDICTPPYFRLYDCVFLAATQGHTLPHFEAGVWAKVELPPGQPGAQTFAFCRAFNGQVVMIELYQRLLKFSRNTQFSDKWKPRN
jgi:hypothetical protein